MFESVIPNQFTNSGKGKGKLLLKIEEISGGKAHTNTLKLYKIF